MKATKYHTRNPAQTRANPLVEEISYEIGASNSVIGLDDPICKGSSRSITINRPKPLHWPKEVVVGYGCYCKNPLLFNRFFFFFFWWGLLHGPQQGPDRMKEKTYKTGKRKTPA